MKKIGNGWQYDVYDLGNGRVLKKFHSPIKSYWVILKAIFPFKEDSLLKVPSFSRGMKRTALLSFEVLKRNNIPNNWTGNPKFLNALDFEQDKVLPIHDAFLNADISFIKNVIDKFVDFNKQLLKSGIIDKSFNITKNYGLNAKGEIILIDIGELFDDSERINKQRKERAWSKSYVAECIKDEEARNYFITEMDKNFGLK
jgi:hypothetical protein